MARSFVSGERVGGRSATVGPSALLAALVASPAALVASPAALASPPHAVSTSVVSKRKRQFRIGRILISTTNVENDRTNDGDAHSSARIGRRDSNPCPSLWLGAGPECCVCFDSTLGKVLNYRSPGEAASLSLMAPFSRQGYGRFKFGLRRIASSKSWFAC